MIRNVCIHVANEQPLLADLFDVPTAADAGLLCTNLRMMDGKRPVFIDNIEATFFFPYHVIRFIEIPEGALAAQAGPTSGRDRRSAPEARDRAAAAGGSAPDEAPLDLPELRLPVPVASRDGDDGELELEIDEGFLQRIRDI